MALKWIAGVAVYALWPALAAAQPALETPPRPTLESVQTRLRSDTPSELGWGAFLAAQFQYKDAVPLIVERLHSLPRLDGSQRHYLVATMLDALIQLDARIPAETILPFYSDWTIHALVLLGSASQDRDAALLSVLRGASGEGWAAAANLLLQTKPDGFAKALLTDLRLAVSATVSDSGTLSSGGVRASSGVGDGIGQLPDGFPPYAHYAFSRQPGAVILALGPVPVYYMRIVRNTFQFPTWSHFSSGPSVRDRLQYLNELLSPNRVEFHPTEYVTLRWTDDARFSAAIAAARKEVRRRYDRLIATLVQSGRLTALDAQRLPPPIDVQVFDLRTDRSRPLPDVE